MKRAALGIVAVAMLLAMPLASSSAFAAGKTARTTVTLTCDRATGSASATFQLYDGATQVYENTLTCGPDSGSGLRSAKLVINVAADRVNVSTWTWETAAGAGGCGAGGGIPYKDTCTDPNGVGSQLVVR